MSRRNAFTTAILLPFITSMAVYILIISHLSHPSSMNMRKETRTYRLLSLERKARSVQPNSVNPLDSLSMGSRQPTIE
jgi:hypothetical protein